MPDQEDFRGRVQAYLLLGAIASKDFAGVAPFKATIGARRAKLYGNLDIENNNADFVTFVNEVKESLKKGGFDDHFIDNVNWTTFRQPGVWSSLKTLNDKLLLFAEYQGTDCPCISALVKHAKDLEALGDAAGGGIT